MGVDLVHGVKVAKRSPALGAEISGADLKKPLSPGFMSANFTEAGAWRRHKRGA